MRGRETLMALPSPARSLATVNGTRSRIHVRAPRRLPAIPSGTRLRGFTESLPLTHHRPATGFRSVRSPRNAESPLTGRFPSTYLGHEPATCDQFAAITASEADIRSEQKWIAPLQPNPPEPVLGERGPRRIGLRLPGESSQQSKP